VKNKIFDPIKPRTTAVVGHGITTRRAWQRMTSRCRRTRRAVAGVLHVLTWFVLVLHVGDLFSNATS
jgi:hypothetical protein